MVRLITVHVECGQDCVPWSQSPFSRERAHYVSSTVTHQQPADPVIGLVERGEHVEWTGVKLMTSAV